MYEYIKVSDRCGYIESPNRVGIIRIGGDDVVTVDSGGDKDGGRRTLRVLNANGYHLRAVYNTHHHADHVGGCKYLQDQTGCKAYLYGADYDYSRHTEMEPAFLYGASPLPGLRHKFLMAPQFTPTELTENDLPDGVKLLHLAGHSFSMVGYAVDDDVFYVGDTVSSAPTLEKYGVSYLYDVQGYLDSIEKVKNLDGSWFIPAHAEATQDIRPLCDINTAAVMKTGDVIRDILTEPKCFEDLLAEVFASYNMTMNLQQYALIGCTVRAYLTWLANNGRAEYVFENNRMLWKKS